MTLKYTLSAAIAATLWLFATAAPAQDRAAEGEQLFRTRCGSCHTVPEPAEVMAQTDADMVKEMADRAKLSPEEQKAVMRFVEAAANAPPTGVAAR